MTRSPLRPERADGHRQRGDVLAQVGLGHGRQGRAGAPRAARRADELAHEAAPGARAPSTHAAGHEQAPPPAEGRERRRPPAHGDVDLRREPRPAANATAAVAARRGTRARGCAPLSGWRAASVIATAAPIEWPTRSSGPPTRAERRSRWTRSATSPGRTRGPPAARPEPGDVERHDAPRPGEPRRGVRPDRPCRREAVQEHEQARRRR